MENNWNKGDHSGLVSIGTHSLYLSSAGPPRPPGAPAIILEAGGGSNSIPYAAVKRLISAFARVHAYDRSGRGRSEASTPASKYNASTMAAELSALLDAARIPPPYILVAHSYGGIISREFLALRDGDVAGMVLVDTNHEDMWKENIFPFKKMDMFFEGVDEKEALGWKSTHKLTAEEWEAFVGHERGDPEADRLQLEANLQSHTDLGEKQQLEKQALGDRSLCVVKGSKVKEYMAMFEAGVKRGNGTEEQREEMRRAFERVGLLDEKFTRDQLRLSKRAKYVYAEKSGHEVQITEPEVIAEEVRWILEELK